MRTQLLTSDVLIRNHWNSVEISSDPSDAVLNAFSIANIAKLATETGVNLASLGIDVPRFNEMLATVRTNQIAAKANFSRPYSSTQIAIKLVDRQGKVEEAKTLWSIISDRKFESSGALLTQLSTLKRLVRDHKITFEESGITSSKLNEIIKAFPDMSFHIAQFDFRSQETIGSLADNSTHPENISIATPEIPNYICRPKNMTQILMNKIYDIGDLFAQLKPSQKLILVYGPTGFEKFIHCTSVEDVAWIYKNCNGATTHINWYIGVD